MSSTLIFITEHELHRFDLKGGRSCRVSSHWELQRVDTEDLAVSVDKILRQGPKRSADLYVLNTDWWLGNCSLGQDVLRHIDEEGLKQSLAIEAEAISGLDAFASQVAYRLKGRSVIGADYLVLQVPEMDLLAIDDVVQQWGGKLQGVAHPTLSTSVCRSTGHRMRLEAWPNVTTVVQPASGTQSRADVLSGDLHMSSIQAEVRQLIGPGIETASSADATNGHVASRDNGWLEVIPGEAARWFEELGLNQISGVEVVQVEEWASRWGEEINKRTKASIPFVPPGKRPVSNQTKVAVAALVGLLTLAGCFGHWLLSQGTLLTRETTINEWESDIKRLGELQKQVQNIEGEATGAQQELAQLSRDQIWAAAVRDVQLHRHAKLLEALSELTPGEILIEKINGEADQLIVSGCSLDSQTCNRLTVDLAERIDAFGWRVHPCKVTLNDKQLYEFEIKLTDDTEAMNPGQSQSSVADKSDAGRSTAKVTMAPIANAASTSDREGHQP